MFAFLFPFNAILNFIGVLDIILPYIAMTAMIYLSSIWGCKSYYLYPMQLFFIWCFLDLFNIFSVALWLSKHLCINWFMLGKILFACRSHFVLI